MSRKREVSYCPILATKPKDGLQKFISLCGSIGGIDTSLVRITAEDTIKRFKQPGKGPERISPLGRQVEARWYRSLKSESPDYGVYDTDYYLAELWACWIVYSRSYMRSLVLSGVTDLLGSVGGIVDLGCGLGLATVAWREMYPNSLVAGTNLDGLKQTHLARHLGDKYDFRVVPVVKNVGFETDVVFASEYFEHHVAPIQHLREVVSTLSPRVILTANAFNAKAIGHFDLYTINGSKVTGRETSKRFNAELRRLGYTLIKTTMWNGRPAFWIRR